MFIPKSSLEHSVVPQYPGRKTSSISLKCIKIIKLSIKGCSNAVIVLEFIWIYLLSKSAGILWADNYRIFFMKGVNFSKLSLICASIICINENIEGKLGVVVGRDNSKWSSLPRQTFSHRFVWSKILIWGSDHILND